MDFKNMSFSAQEIGKNERSIPWSESGLAPNIFLVGKAEYLCRD
jgi:hypothetical protein